MHFSSASISFFTGESARSWPFESFLYAHPETLQDEIHLTDCSNAFDEGSPAVNMFKSCSNAGIFQPLNGCVSK